MILDPQQSIHIRIPFFPQLKLFQNPKNIKIEPKLVRVAWRLGLCRQPVPLQEPRICLEKDELHGDNSSPARQFLEISRNTSLNRIEEFHAYSCYIYHTIQT